MRRIRKELNRNYKKEGISVVVILFLFLGNEFSCQ